MFSGGQNVARGAIYGSTQINEIYTKTNWKYLIILLQKIITMILILKI